MVRMDDEADEERDRSQQREQRTGGSSEDNAALQVVLSAVRDSAARARTENHEFERRRLRNLGRLQATLGDFEFSAVGSVDNAMATARPFASGLVIQLMSEAPPHDLAALKEKTIAPAQLGFDRPDGFNEDEFKEVVSSYAGAELLDRERRTTEARAKQEEERENRKMILQMAVPVLTFLLGIAAAYFGLK